MSTNYKIRLKRFNGTDYDTLNLMSENIIMDSGNDLQTDIVPSNNGILKNIDGTFTVATLGTDYTSIDDSATTSTTKTWSIDKIKTSAGGALYFTNIPVASSTTNCVNLSNSAITSDHVLTNIEFADASGFEGVDKLEWTTSDGLLLINGYTLTATTANITLVKKNN